MAFGDVHNIEDRLKQIDDRILRIDFDHKKKRHHIIAWDSRELTEYIAFTVPAGQLNALTVLEFYRIRNGSYSAFDELRSWEAQKERDENRKLEEMAHSMADLLHKPLLQDAFG
jgi:hypothetical protein